MCQGGSAHRAIIPRHREPPATLNRNPSLLTLTASSQALDAWAGVLLEEGFGADY